MGLGKRVPSCAILFICASLISTVHSIGVNYGTLGNNLPPPAQVAQFLKDKTIIDRIKIFDVNADILRAFADTGILVAVTAPNGEIPALVNPDTARIWVETNIKPFYPQTKINYICVGNEILHVPGEKSIFADNLVGAMKSIHQALVFHQMTDIKVTTPHSLAILMPADEPSSSRFRADWDQSVLAPMLQFLRDTNSPFMVNPYPFFGYRPDMNDFALFKSDKGVVFDKVTNKWYSNLFDKNLDEIYTSMTNLGYGDVEIVVGETGWPSKGELPNVNIDNAVSFNGALVRKYNAGEGTPLMPNKKFETYIFGLFNENMKPGAETEKNFGLFWPDFTPVYNVGIMKEQSQQVIPPATPVPAVPQPLPATPVPVVPQPLPATPAQGQQPINVAPAQGQGKKWCIAKPGTQQTLLQSNLDYACAQSAVDCKPLQVNGLCYKPDNLYNQASYAMNAYYQSTNKFDCNFLGSGLITDIDPSDDICKFLA